MTNKDYLFKQSLESIDQELYNRAKSKIRTKTFFILFLIFGSFTLLFLIMFFSFLMSEVNLDYVSFIMNVSASISLSILFKKLDTKNKQESENVQIINDYYFELYLKKNFNMPKQFLDVEYNDKFLLFNSDISIVCDFFTLQYNAKDDIIRILTPSLSMYSFYLKNIIEYELLDEGRVVCSAKRQDKKIINKYNHNKFNCDVIEIKIVYYNEDNKISTYKETVMKDIKRNNKKYCDFITDFDKLVSVINNTILQTSDDDNISTNDCGSTNSSDIYNKLLEIKELYDKGIIDLSTYEDLKNKLIEKYKELNL